MRLIQKVPSKLCRLYKGLENPYSTESEYRFYINKKIDKNVTTHIVFHMQMMFLLPTGKKMRAYLTFESPFKGHS